MCLLALAIDPNPQYRLVLVANRDEFHARPALPLHEWEQPAGVVAGRDQLGGGTWLGVNRCGRIAALTNFREADTPPINAPSRGALVTNCLVGSESPATVGSLQSTQLQQYAGFSLITGSAAEGYTCYSNRYEKVVLQPGVHGLSNGSINNDWPKVVGLRGDLENTIAQGARLEHDALFALLEVRQRAAEEHLPDTGVGLEAERFLSSRFILSHEYGTRSASVILLERSGQLTVHERRYAPSGEMLGNTQIAFSIE